MSPNTTILYFLLLLFSIFIVIGVVVPWLARRWYVRRNGQPRERRHANDAHRKMTFGVSAVSIFVSLAANVLHLMPPVLGLILILNCFVVYVTGSTYLWRKESSNKDDYRYELLVSGGAGIGGGLIILAGAELLF